MVFATVQKRPRNLHEIKISTTSSTLASNEQIKTQNCLENNFIYCITIKRETVFFFWKKINRNKKDLISNVRNGLKKLLEQRRRV